MRTLYFWGAGDEAKKLLSRNLLWWSFVIAVVDKSETAFCLSLGEETCALQVISPDEVDWNDKSLFFIISTITYYDEIADLLRRHGKKEHVDFIGVPDAWHEFCRRVLHWNEMHRMRLLEDCVRQYKKWLPDLGDVFARPSARRLVQSFLESGGNRAEYVMLACCADEMKHTISLDGALIEYDTLHDLAVIFPELLAEEEDYFESDADAPVIIDGGANIGLAIYYFLHLYPHARVIAFEPNPRIFGILSRNIKRNGWENVTVYPYALSGQEGHLSFFTQECGLAGSLTHRNFENVENGISEIEVSVVRLSSYIDGPVDYLKLDIEGSETEVMEEIAEKIGLVKYITIEFHDGALSENNSRAKILTLLEKNGFDVNIRRMPQGTIFTRPMRYIGTRVSEIIQGIRRKR